MSLNDKETNANSFITHPVAGFMIWALSGLLVMLLLVGCEKPADSTQSRSEFTFELKEIQRFTNDFAITTIAWHPEGRFLAVGQVLDKRIAIWDTQTDKRVYTIESEAGGVSSMAYSPDGTYLAVGREFSRLTKGGGHVHLYDTKSGHLVRRFPSSTDPVESYDAEAIAFSPDGHYIAASGYGSPLSIGVYDMTTGEVFGKTPPLQRGAGTIEVLTFAPDGKFLAFGRNLGDLEIWSMSPWQLLHRLEGQTGGIHALAFSPDGKYLASGTNVGERWDRSAKPPRQMNDQFTDDVQLWSIPAFEKVIAFPSRHFLQVPSSTHIIRLQFFPDGKHLLVGARSKGLEIIDIEKGKVAFYQRDFPGIVHPALSPEAGRIAIGLEDSLRIYQLTGR